MKILNICGYTWEIGGPAKIIYDHAEVQIANGHQVSILTPVWPNDKLYDIPKGVEVISVKKHWFSKFFPEFSLEAYHWLKKNGNDFDVIHVHGPFHFAGMLPWILNLKPVKVITVHGLLDKWAIRNSYWKKQIVSFLIQKRIFKNADIIQINNEDEKQDLLNYLGYQHPNVALIPNGMKMSSFEVLPPKGLFRKTLGIDESQHIVLFLSRINIKKGLDLLLRAFKLYLQKNKNAVLILAGSDDGYLAETSKFIAENKLEKSILLVGILTGNQKLQALADADVFVLPSYSEGFSIAVLEAMASNVPVVVSDRVGFGPQIIANNAGQIVKLDPESISLGLEKVLTDSTLGQKLAENAKKMLKENFTIEIVANTLLNKFSNAILHKKP